MATTERASPGPVRIGISACLLGEMVRYDGGHKRDPFLTDTLARFVEWVPVCPEVECGLGTPREPIRLVRTDRVRLITVNTGIDLTDRMADFAQRRLTALAAEDLSGYVLKKDSPSCGLHRVKVYGPNAAAVRSGRGMFAASLVERFPNLPVEEEGRLCDATLRENFIERVFAYSRLRALFDRRWTVGSLVEFHTAHKLTLMAHSPRAYQQLGRVVATARSTGRGGLERRYVGEFMTCLAIIATRRRHTNVLQHAAGHLKKRLDAGCKTELLGVIDDYRRGLVPLVVPVTLLRHFVRLHNVTYLAGQQYLNPHPKELMLLNHV